jgi:hypothetical protein
VDRTGHCANQGDSAGCRLKRRWDERGASTLYSPRSRRIVTPAVARLRALISLVMLSTSIVDARLPRATALYRRNRVIHPSIAPSRRCSDMRTVVRPNRTRGRRHFTVAVPGSPCGPRRRLWSCVIKAGLGRRFENRHG